MIIRHDLQLIFLHVPKCAGKELRAVFLEGAPADAAEDWFNFAYSPTLHRHVDRAHLTAEELAHEPVFQHLSRYRVIAAIRNPYERLCSAIIEYYRQFSSADEAIANGAGPSLAMQLHYLRQLPLHHSLRDPRFVHSQPITWFTHYGSRPMADHLLRCESLAEDFAQLAQQLDLPPAMQERGVRALRSQPGQTTMGLHPPLEESGFALANWLYSQDFRTFGYPMRPVPPGQDDPLATTIASLQPGRGHSHSLEFLERASLVHWHWGPSSQRPADQTLAPTRLPSDG